MKTKVIATADKAGQTFFPNPKPAKDGKTYGYVRFEQNELILGGDVVKKRTVSVLKQFEKSAADLIQPGMELPGNIVEIDSLEKSFDDHEPLQVPVRDENRKETGEMRTLTHKGKPVYREVIYDATGKLNDFYLDYDQSGEVKAKASAAANADTKIS